MPENRFVGEIARTYDQPGTGMFADDVLEATVDCLVELSGGGAAMEFAIGTGRVAVPLAARGVPVAGIELSADMLAVLRSKPEASDITAVEGDMAVTFVEGEFSLVYLVFNTINNPPPQDQQGRVFGKRCSPPPPGPRFFREPGAPLFPRYPPAPPGSRSGGRGPNRRRHVFMPPPQKPLSRARHSTRRGEGGFTEFTAPLPFGAAGWVPLGAGRAGGPGNLGGGGGSPPVSGGGPPLVSGWVSPAGRVAVADSPTGWPVECPQTPASSSGQRNGLGERL